MTIIFIASCLLVVLCVVSLALNLWIVLAWIGYYSIVSTLRLIEKVMAEMEKMKGIK